MTTVVVVVVDDDDDDDVVCEVERQARMCKNAWRVVEVEFGI